MRCWGGPDQALQASRATWIFGAGMTIYGCVWLVTALLNIHAADFLQSLVAGGMNWTIEGILFVTVAYLASYSERFARQTLTSQPA
jgi:membrane protein implicated in regulation of membrane protease activity